jgi:hypothetical protein
MEHTAVALITFDPSDIFSGENTAVGSRQDAGHPFRSGCGLVSLPFSNDKWSEDHQQRVYMT